MVKRPRVGRPSVPSSTRRKSILADLSSFDVAELADLDAIAEWPPAVRQFVLTMIALIVLAIGYFLFLSATHLQFVNAQAREGLLRGEFSLKAMEASQLNAMQGQTQALDSAFKTLLRQLPSSAEVPSLVDNISATGLGSGLEFRRIQLQEETAREFFYELPIEIELIGSYHDFGMFVSGVANLGRVVTLHDFRIESGSEKAQEMKLLARTYRYDEEFVFASERQLEGKLERQPEPNNAPL